MTTDTTRDRKVRMSRTALWFLAGGLAGCLAAAAYKPEIAAALAGYYAGYCGGVAAVLGFFSNANARVHEAQAKAESAP